MTRPTRTLIVVAVVTLMLPAAAFADTIDPKPAPVLWLPTDQLWTWIAAAVAILPMYLINHYAPWLTDPVKAAASTVFVAVAAGITQAITAGGVGFNQTTLQFIVTALGAAFLAHSVIWKPTGIATRLKAGTNKQDLP